MEQRTMNESTEVRVVKITGREFEAGPDGWCKHCGWASFGHIIGAQTGRLLCKADEPIPAQRTGAES
jgi:hypothetical protein